MIIGIVCEARNRLWDGLIAVAVHVHADCWSFSVIRYAIKYIIPIDPCLFDLVRHAHRTYTRKLDAGLSFINYGIQIRIFRLPFMAVHRLIEM